MRLSVVYCYCGEVSNMYFYEILILKSINDEPQKRPSLLSVSLMNESPDHGLLCM